jgi:NTP pyrophosphatase (non-canonical NTP hydrolase)
MSKWQELDKLAKRIDDVAKQKGWDKSWSKGGCYLHLEASEFIESLRGKGDDPPQKEAGDIIMALFSMLAHYDINPSEVFELVEQEILPDLETDESELETDRVS